MPSMRAPDARRFASESRASACRPWSVGCGRRMSARRSVSRVLSRPAFRRNGDGHPSEAAGRPTALAADPRAGQRTSPPPTVARPRVAPSYLALLRVEFARFTPAAGLRRRSASSLWHWSSPHGGRALPATLRCGARTFLTPPTGRPIAGARPSDRLADSFDATPGRGKGRVSHPGAARLTRDPRSRHDRWPRWPARRRRG